MNDYAFASAVKVFHRARGGAVQCLRQAMEAYFSAVMEDTRGNLSAHIADSKYGPGTALVIFGFKDISEIETFVAEKLNAPGK